MRPLSGQEFEFGLSWCYPGSYLASGFVWNFILHTSLYNIPKEIKNQYNIDYFGNCLCDTITIYYPQTNTKVSTKVDTLARKLNNNILKFA